MISSQQHELYKLYLILKHEPNQWMILTKNSFEQFHCLPDFKNNIFVYILIDKIINNMPYALPLIRLDEEFNYNLRIIQLQEIEFCLFHKILMTEQFDAFTILSNELKIEFSHDNNKAELYQQLKKYLQINLNDKNLSREKEIKEIQETIARISRNQFYTLSNENEFQFSQLKQKEFEQIFLIKMKKLLQSTSKKDFLQKLRSSRLFQERQKINFSFIDIEIENTDDLLHFLQLKENMIDKEFFDFIEETLPYYQFVKQIKEITEILEYIRQEKHIQVKYFYLTNNYAFISLDAYVFLNKEHVKQFFVQNTISMENQSHYFLTKMLDEQKFKIQLMDPKKIQDIIQFKWLKYRNGENSENQLANRKKLKACFIKYPLLSIQCYHYSGFDYLIYYNFKCSICNKQLEIDKIVIDTEYKKSLKLIQSTFLDQFKFNIFAEEIQPIQIFFKEGLAYYKIREVSYQLKTIWTNLNSDCLKNYPDEERQSIEDSVQNLVNKDSINEVDENNSELITSPQEINNEIQQSNFQQFQPELLESINQIPSAGVFLSSVANVFKPIQNNPDSSSLGIEAQQQYQKEQSDYFQQQSNQDQYISFK